MFVHFSPASSARINTKPCVVGRGGAAGGAGSGGGGVGRPGGAGGSELEPGGAPQALQSSQQCEPAAAAPGCPQVKPHSSGFSQGV